eukprot:5198173-Pyramimonas_sp.AAC.1
MFHNRIPYIPLQHKSISYPFTLVGDICARAVGGEGGGVRAEDPRSADHAGAGVHQTGPGIGRAPGHFLHRGDGRARSALLR